MNLEQLRQQHCIPRKGTTDLLNDQPAQELLALLPGWTLAPSGQGIYKDFRFKDFHRTMAFVNALAWIAHQQDHHPDFEVGYNHCQVCYSTHDVGGLSLNDFICAAKIEALLAS